MSYIPPLNSRCVLIFRLLFDGQRIQDDQTALDLDLEEGDSIEVLLERESSSTTYQSSPIPYSAWRMCADDIEVGGFWATWWSGGMGWRSATHRGTRVELVHVDWINGVRIALHMWIVKLYEWRRRSCPCSISSYWPYIALEKLQFAIKQFGLMSSRVVKSEWTWSQAAGEQ